MRASTEENDGETRAAPATLPVWTFSTAHLPPSERHDAWLRRDWPRSEPIFRTDPTEPFDTHWETVPLGPLTFVYCEITGMRWERRREAIRTSSFDPLIVNMMDEGLAEGDMDGRSFRQPAGHLLIDDLGRHSIHVSTASVTHSIVVPRGVAETWLSPLDDLHGMVIGPPAAAMIMAQARQVRQMFGQLTPGTGERLGRVFMEMLAALVTDRRQLTAPASDTALLRSRAQALVERLLDSEKVTAERLCKRLDVSRAELFEAFRGEGGVQHYVLGLRLERARAAVADLGRGEPIGEIAHRFGFSDASHLSRTFRVRFGMTPREYRHLAHADQKETPAPKG